MSKHLNQLYKYITKGQEWILDNCIFLTRGGSHLYGLNHDKSDEDFIGVTIPPISYWVGTDIFEQWNIKQPEINSETTIFSIKKYLKLAIDSNPNIIEFLFIKKDNPNIQIWKDVWQKIHDNRTKFVSKRAFHTFSGYSHSQRKKLINKRNNKNGRRYITDEFNWDTKFAMHAFRLLIEGIELLETGNIEFPRPDKEDLLDIRFGRKYNEKSIDSFLDDLDALEKNLKISKEKSTLPESGNKKFLNSFQIKIFEEYVWPNK